MGHILDKSFQTKFSKPAKIKTPENSSYNVLNTLYIPVNKAIQLNFRKTNLIWHPIVEIDNKKWLHLCFEQKNKALW